MTTPYNLSPLTTTWTPPRSCSGKIALEGTWRTADLSPTAPYAAGLSCSKYNDDPTQYEVQPNVDCWPNRIPPDAAYYLDTAYYSPGLVCPSGHTTACSSTSGGSYDFQFDFTLEPGGTAAGCCPSNYVCAIYDDFQSCVFTATSTADSVTICSVSSSAYDYVIPRPTGVQRGTTVYRTQQVLYAPMYRLNWRSVDRPAVTVTETPWAASMGLSKGARAGIGIGVSIGVLAIIGLLGWFILARRRAKMISEGEVPPQATPEPSRFEKAEMSGQQSWGHELSHEATRHGEQVQGTEQISAVPGHSVAGHRMYELGQ
ncbi:hypothetical protein F4777DRAFT_584647 [Nemania sp. FL0916]|nr:hypothetical protein F4777DRAFT_584647 [Nemania sp. FL0916]